MFIYKFLLFIAVKKNEDFTEIWGKVIIYKPYYCKAARMKSFELQSSMLYMARPINWSFIIEVFLIPINLLYNFWSVGL